MDAFDNSEDLTYCTGVIVPGYDRGESLCPLPYTPNRHAFSYPKSVQQYPLIQRVRIVQIGGIDSPEYRSEVQVSVNGEDWFPTHVSLGKDLSMPVLRKMASATTTFDHGTSQISWSPMLSAPPAPAQEPVSLCSLEKIHSDDTACKEVK